MLLKAMISLLRWYVCYEIDKQKIIFKITLHILILHNIAIYG